MDYEGGNIKGYKITDGSRKKRIGVACSSFKELKIKGCKKLKIKCNVNDVDVLLSDGTIVEDELYFRTLPGQIVFILKQPGEKITEGVDIIYEALKSFNAELLKTASEVREFFDIDTQNKIKVLSQFLEEKQELEKAVLSSRSDDPEWFKDLETCAETKEEFMRKRSKGRILRYFYNTKDKIRCSNLYCRSINAKRCLDNSFNEFYSCLKRDDFFSYYFDRSNARSLCDNNGLFLCQGLWNNDKCTYISENNRYDHQINPYVSKERRIVFATWNLDHRIERSRTVIPSLLLACEFFCENGRSFKVNSDYFYDLLFTTKNLKLVHTVCHDKNEHSSAQCDREQFLTQNEQYDKKCSVTLRKSNHYGVPSKKNKITLN